MESLALAFIGDICCPDGRRADERTECLPRGKPQTLQRVTHCSLTEWMDGWDDRGKISLMIPFGKNGRAGAALR